MGTDAPQTKRWTVEKAFSDENMEQKALDQ
jgi:hypothetical protein